MLPTKQAMRQFSSCFFPGKALPASPGHKAGNCLPAGPKSILNHKKETILPHASNFPTSPGRITKMGDGIDFLNI